MESVGAYIVQRRRQNLVNQEQTRRYKTVSRVCENVSCSDILLE